MIKAKLLNSSAELNDFFYIASVDYVPGENLTVAFQLYDSQKNIRYIPGEDAEIEVTLVNKDNSELEKAAAVIDVSDRSMWKIELSQAETINLAGQNLKIVLDEEGDGDPIHITLLANVLIRTNLSGDC